MVLAMLLAVLWSSSPAAQETVTVVLRNQGMDSSLQDRLIKELAAGLNRIEGLLAFVPEMTGGIRDRAEAIEHAKERLEQAREAHRKFQPERALELLAEFDRERIEGCGGADQAHLRERYLLEGRVQFVSGKRDMARLAFLRLAALDPDWEPEPEEMAPKIAALLHQAKEELQKRRPATLNLQGMPVGANVRFDGRKAGRLPLLLEVVRPGRHCLEVSAPGHAAWTRSVTVPEGGNLQLRAVLFPLGADGLRKGDFPPAKGPEPGELVRLFGTSYLLFGEANENAVRMWLVSGADGRMHGPAECGGTDPTPDLVKMVDCQVAFVREGREKLTVKRPVMTKWGTGNGDPESNPLIGLAAKPGPPNKDEPKAGSAWYQEWWFWTLVGGVVAVSAGVTMGLLLDAGADDPGYRVILTRPR